jgi:tetratricopeptide (TPR) repeat protein
MAHAKGAWLLWLDAGETLNDEDGRNLKEFVASQADPTRAYLMLVRLPLSDPSSSTEQIARVRLLPRDPRIQFAGRISESLTESLTSLRIELAGLPFVIRRNERELDARVKKHRAQRNLAIAELEMRETGPNARLWNCIGDALQTRGESGKAIDSFRQALSLAERGSPAMLEAYYGLLTSLGPTAEERTEQMTKCVQALEVFPTDAQLLCALGGYLQVQGNLPLAGQSYLTAYKFGQVNPLVWHVRDIRDIAAVCHSLILQLRQQQDEAVRFLEGALGDHPESTRLRRRLIDLFIQQGDRDAALAHVSALPASTPHLEALRSAVRGACFAVQQNLIAAKAYLNAGYTHGCRDPICLKWLSLCLLSAGEKDSARTVLEEWKQVEPRNSEVDKLLATISQPSTPSAPANLRFDAPLGAGGGALSPVKLNLPAWSPAANPR